MIVDTQYLSRFRHPGTKRGVHWTPIVNHHNIDLWADRASEMGMGWALVMDNGQVGGDGKTSSTDLCVALLRRGIEPVVRVYRGEPNPGLLSVDEKRAITALVNQGVEYFSLNCEPNLPVEWKAGEWQKGGRPELVMDGWVRDALFVSSVGGVPGYPPLAPCSHHPESGSIPWNIRAINYLRKMYPDEVKQLIAQRLFAATHDYSSNHFYRTAQGVWHFEYPYDPIAIEKKRGTFLQDDNSINGWRAFDHLFSEAFGVHIPIIGTEGGIVAKGGFFQEDTDYPGYDDNSMAEAVVAMYDYIEEETPPNYFGLCSWILVNRENGGHDENWEKAAWYKPGKVLPVVKALVEHQQKPTPKPTKIDPEGVAWDLLGIARNPKAALYRTAKAAKLGAPRTPEREVIIGDRTFIFQVFSLGYAYCEKGDWNNVLTGSLP